MTAKKKHLIELMIEAGVKWPEGAEYAAQDKTGEVCFFCDGKPDFDSSDKMWMANGCTFLDLYSISIGSLCSNYHQCIVSKSKYEKALTDAGVGQVGEMPSNEPVNTRSETLPVATSSTMEELLSNYQRYQQFTAEALQALQNKGKQLGLVITVAEPEEQLNITDIKDLRIGDVIWIGKRKDITRPNNNGLRIGNYTITAVHFHIPNHPVSVTTKHKKGYWCPDLQEREWKFVSRPTDKE